MQMGYSAGVMLSDLNRWRPNLQQLEPMASNVRIAVDATEGKKPLDAWLVTTTLIVNLMRAGLGLYLKAQHPSAHPLVVTCWEALPLTMVRVVLVSGLGATLALGILLMYAGMKMSLQRGSPSGSA